MNGRVVYQGVAHYSGREIAYALPNLSFLPDGMYTLKMDPAMQEALVFKLIKQ